MAALETPAVNLGWKAKPFGLKGVDGKIHTLDSLTEDKEALLVMFICNHCPFVQAIAERLTKDCRELLEYKIASVAIMSNDAYTYPDDSFENMKAFSKQYGFTFPYVIDETQQVAKDYNAVCTPDFFGFNKKLELCYRGRIDGAHRKARTNEPRELFNAMMQIARTGKGPTEQFSSIGCSIKWSAQAA